MAPGYELRTSTDCVEFWSEKRLPFEPKAELRQMRDELRLAVTGLNAHNKELLHAEYWSSARAPCDAENILLYNVGAASFAQSASNGLRIERVHEQPPPSPRSDPKAVHYHRYATAPPEGSFARWRRQSTLVNWQPVETRRISSDTKPAPIWFALRPIAIASKEAQHSEFGIELRVQVPRDATVNASAIVKPLLDGAISSCHSHDGSDIASIVERISAALVRDRSEIRSHLMGNDADVLGRRRLIYLRANGVQWNPADDCCVAAELRIDRVLAPGSPWIVSGALFSVTAI